MITKYYKIIYTVLFVSFTFIIQAQTKWTSWEELYSDNTVKIEIQFKIYKNSCEPGARDNKYKYKITGKYADTKNLYWKLKYKDCNNVTKILNNEIIVGGNDVIEGIVESPDYVFKCKKIIKKKYDIGFSSSKNDTAFEYAKNKLKNKTKWTEWEKLYSDKSITVEIQYLLHKEACKNGGKNNKYRYKITGLLYNEDKWLDWEMKYIDCNNNTQISSNKINIGKNGSRGIVESIDYIFTGNKIIKKHYKERIVSNKQNTEANSFSNKKNNKQKIKPSDNKGYKVAKRRVRKTIPYKWSFLLLGEGVYTKLGTTENIYSNTFSLNNMSSLKNGWFDSFGLYRKVGIRPKFTRKKGRDISRATLIGIFSDIAYDYTNINDFKRNGLVKLEFGFNFWQWIRLSGGIINYNGISNFNNYVYSGTFGLNFKIRNWYINANYIQTSNRSFDNFNSYVHFGFGYALNLFRAVPKETKLKLKKMY